MTDYATSSTADSSALIWEQAADWLLRLNQAPDCPELAAEHLQWLAQSEQHAQAYRQTVSLWELSAALAQPAAASTSLTADVAIAKPRRRWLPLATAAALVALVSLGLLKPKADFSTEHGQHLQVQLSDGSQLHLASDSAVDQAFTANERHLTLQQGQLFIEVTRDLHRPLLIDAGDVRVRVTGTAFEVQHTPDFTSISVAHGSVEVSNPLLPSAMTLQAGDQLRINPAIATWQRSSHNPQQVAAWRDWQLSVEDQSLAEVLSQLQHYQSGWIVLADTELGEQRLTASLNLREPTAALAAALEPLEAHAEQIGPILLVRSR